MKHAKNAALKCLRGKESSENFWHAPIIPNVKIQNRLLKLLMLPVRDAASKLQSSFQKQDGDFTDAQVILIVNIFHGMSRPTKNVPNAAK
jgi:hypothetical protein